MSALSSSPSDSNPADAPLRPIRLLYVDDEPALVGLAERKLRGMGFEVVGMTNSQDALNHFQDHPEAFDAIISDMSMPAPTGEQLVRLIHRLRPDLPVILISGHEPQISGPTAQNLNVVAFLSKPFRMEELAERLHSMLQR